jgi:ATP-dependent Zn protease
VAAGLLTLVSGAQITSSQQITFQTFLREYLTNPKLDHLEYDLQANRVYIYLSDNAPQDRFIKSDPITEDNYNNSNRADRDKSLQTSETNSSRTQQQGSGPVAYFTVLNVDDFEKKLQQAEIELGIPPSKSTTINYTNIVDWRGILGMAVEPLIIISLFMFTGRLLGGGAGRGIGGIFKTTQVSKAVQQKSKVTFKDVAGMEEAKQEIYEFVSILKNPERYRSLGAKIPRGAILMGPPGTGM